MTFEVSPATPADRGRVVETVVAAFRADPAFRYFFADPASFEAEATIFAGHLFDKRVLSGTVWVIDGGAGAVSMWDAPLATPGSSSLGLPAATLARLDAYDAAVHDALPSEPHWYLGVLASHPIHAGRRLGRAVMAAGLVHARTDGLPAYLETTNPGNVELYRRSGWEVTAERSVGELPVWVMAHHHP